MHYPLYLFKHRNMAPAIFKKQGGNLINMLSEGRKTFYRSFLIELLKNIFLKYKHVHIMKLFIGFLKYLWHQLKLGNKTIWCSCADSPLPSRQTYSIKYHNLKWERKVVTLICIQNWQESQIMWTFPGTTPLKGLQSIYGIKIFKHSETMTSVWSKTSGDEGEASLINRLQY